MNNKSKKNLSPEDIVKIAEALDRIEKKIDLALNISRPQYTDIKGYPAKSRKEKISFFWTKGNSERVILEQRQNFTN